MRLYERRPRKSIEGKEGRRSWERCPTCCSSQWGCTHLHATLKMFSSVNWVELLLCRVESTAGSVQRCHAEDIILLWVLCTATTHTHTCTHVWCLNRFMRKEREQGRIPFNWIAPGGCITIALLIRPGDPGRAGLGRDCNRLLMLLLLLFNCRLQRSQKESKGIPSSTS